jgi:hypothetical protein
MNSAVASIGKNMILMSVVFLSMFNFYFGWLNVKELLGVQVLAGLAYIFLSCYEYLNASYKAALPIQRYPYFSSRFIMFRAMKISLFTAFGLLLLTSGSTLRYLSPICIIIASTETVILYLKYRKGLCFVNIYANYLLIVENKFSKVFASEIMIIEFRHDIFYFVKKNRKTVSIKLEHIRHRESFVQNIHDWINRNHILVSAESEVKIKELIA